MNKFYYALILWWSIHFTFISTVFLSSFNETNSVNELKFMDFEKNRKTVTISTPVSGAIISAGSSELVQLDYKPNGSKKNMALIILSCDSSMISTQNITGASMNFSVPLNFYGDSCVFSVNATDYTYIPAKGVFVTITQPLTFNSPAGNATININDPIYISMSTGAVNVSVSVVLRFACLNYKKSIPKFTITTSSAAYSYDYPSGAYGLCTITVSSAPSYLVLPSALSLSLKYSLNISAPATIFPSQPFLVTVSCAQTPDFSFVTLNLIYTSSGASSIITSYTGATINQQITLFAPKSLVIGPGYTLQVAPSANFNEATSAMFSAGNIQLRFSQPEASSTYVYPSIIPILVDSANFSSILPANQPISVTLTCGVSIIDTFSIKIGTQVNYTNPNNGIGACSFTASSSIDYLIAPEPVSITINGTISLSPVASSIPAGQTVQLGLTYNPVTSVVTSSVVLSCPNLNPLSASVTGTTPSFAVSNYLYGDPCIFSVVSPYYNYNSSNTVSTIVTQTLSFTLPSTSSITINNTIPIKVATSPCATISETIYLAFNCSIPSTFTGEIFDVITADANAYNYSYPSSAFGSCVLIVKMASSYFVVPPPFNLNLQYNVTIAAPATIFPSQPFLVTVSCAQTPGVSIVTLNLVYDRRPVSPLTAKSFSNNMAKFIFPSALTSKYSSLIATEKITQSYNVTINQQATLIAPNDLFIGSEYFLQLDSNDNFDVATSSIIKAAIIQVLTVTKPASVIFGQAVTLKVDTNGPFQIPYTASFTCSAGSYQINGLKTGVTYRLVPTGIYGSVVIIATATNAVPDMSSFNIEKPSENIPAAFIPGQLPNYPSIYSNITEGKLID